MLVRFHRGGSFNRAAGRGAIVGLPSESPHPEDPAVTPLSRSAAASLAVALVSACSDAAAPASPRAGAVSAAEAGGPPGATFSAAASAASPVDAVGTYHFLIPADFNGGIFGIDIDNDVSFVAKRDAGGAVSGRFRYVQSALGEDFIFSGTVTCLAVYDTPVLQGFPEIPAGTGNRSKWGGLIETSNDPTLPAGGYIWFSSIDNGPDHPDLSTLSGFGNEAANEAFCASPNVPNPNFGPHAVGSGQIQVR